MGRRHWHLEHDDGREWTLEELGELAERLCEEMRIAPYDETLYVAVVDQEGTPWLICDRHDYALCGEPDVRLVWGD